MTLHSETHERIRKSADNSKPTIPSVRPPNLNLIIFSYNNNNDSDRSLITVNPQHKTVLLQRQSSGNALYRINRWQVPSVRVQDN